MRSTRICTTSMSCTLTRSCSIWPIRLLLCAHGDVPAVRAVSWPARDSDYEAFTWYPHDPRLDRWLELYRLAARANGGEPDAGRRLLAWSHDAGFEDVTATASVWCYATATSAHGGRGCGPIA
jgi:hypothetical protein